MSLSDSEKIVNLQGEYLFHCIKFSNSLTYFNNEILSIPYILEGGEVTSYSFMHLYLNEYSSEFFSDDIADLLCMRKQLNNKYLLELGSFLNELYSNQKVMPGHPKSCIIIFLTSGTPLYSKVNELNFTDFRLLWKNKAFLSIMLILNWMIVQ